MNSAKRELLVVGGTGFLGRSLVGAALSDYTVTVLTRRVEEAARKLFPNPEVRIVTLDSTNLDKLISSRKFFGVVYTAVEYGRGSAKSAVVDANVTLPLKLASIANSHGVPAFVYLDTFFNKHAAQYNYLSEYRESKKEAVAKLKLLKGPTKIANLILEHLYGPDEAEDKFLPVILRDLLANKPVVELTPGEQRRDFVYVDDVSAAILTVLSRIDTLPQFSQFEVGMGVEHSIREVVTLVKELSKSSSELRFGALPYRGHELMTSKADIEPLRRLGWNPAVSLREGLTNIIKSRRNFK